MHDVTAMATLHEYARANARLNRDGWKVRPTAPTPRERVAEVLVALAVRLAPVAASAANPAAGGPGIPAPAWSRGRTVRA